VANETELLKCIAPDVCFCTVNSKSLYTSTLDMEILAINWWVTLSLEARRHSFCTGLVPICTQKLKALIHAINIPILS
jgi:hypothetical protein